MSRWLAGVYDPARRGGGEDRLARALVPHPATVLDCGALRVAFTGPAPPPGEPLCLLDGYLDNAAELRRALGDAGADAALDCPERLLACAYRRWGAVLLERLRGDFALLIWDREHGEGLLARDQIGVRPLFLHDAGGTLCFAGEVRHLLALLPRRPPPDAASVAHWIAVGTRPGTSTLYDGVRRLRPAGALLFDRGSVRERRWWTPCFQEPLELPPRELAARTRAALELAVERRIAPEGRTGVLMSGGLDSSSVAALCEHVAPARTLACSATFPEHPAADEAPLIDELADTLALPSLRAVVRPGGAVASALESLAAWELPLLGWGDFWTLPLLRAAAAQGAQVVLDGDGGDELFGPRADLLADHLLSGRPRAALAVARRLPGADAGPSRREVARMFSSLALGALPYRLHDTLRRPFARREVPAWLLPASARALVGSDDPLAWKRLDGPRWWARVAHALTCAVEETGVFEHQRRRAALAGVEQRHPLFDLDLVALCLRQPPEATLDPRFNRPVLRASMEGLLPDSVRLRPGKARFEALVVDCLRGGDLAAVRGLLGDHDAQLGAYLDLARMRAALLDDDAELRASPFRWMWQVWRLVTAECWLRSQAGATAPRSAAARLLPADAAPSAARVAITASYVFPP